MEALFLERAFRRDNRRSGDSGPRDKMTPVTMREMVASGLGGA